MGRLLFNAKHYRDCAEEIRTLADYMTKPDRKQIMEGIACEYDEWAEQRDREAREADAQERLEGKRL